MMVLKTLQMTIVLFKLIIFKEYLQNTGLHISCSSNHSYSFSISHWFWTCCEIPAYFIHHSMQCCTNTQNQKLSKDNTRDLIHIIYQGASDITNHQEKAVIPFTSQTSWSTSILMKTLGEWKFAWQWCRISQVLLFPYLQKLLTLTMALESYCVKNAPCE